MNDPQNNFNDPDALLSAYVDGELDFADRRRVEELINTNPSYAQDVEELRLIKRWLRDLPSPAPRRSFTLDPQTAPRPRRLVFPTLRWATAIAAVLLMLTVSVDVLGGISGGMGGGAAPAALSTSTSGAASSASGGAAADQELRQPTGSAAASAAGEAQEDLPDPAAQNAEASTSGSAAAAASASAAANTEASDSAAAGSLPDTAASFAAPSASAAASASASASAEQGEGMSANGASAAPSPSSAATMLASGAANTEANNGGGARSASPLASTDTTGPDTVPLTAQPASPAPPTDTLRIAQVVLLIATVVLGTGAWFAQRRNI